MENDDTAVMEDGALDPALMMLDALFREQEGWLAVCGGNRDAAGKLDLARTEYLRWPNQRHQISAVVEAINADEQEGWFCAHLLDKRERKKANALPLVALYADLDGAALPNGPLTPSVVVETSPGKFHAFWRLNEPIVPSDGQIVNKRIGKHIGADDSGADLTQLVRLPGTRNHKYPALPEVRLLTIDGPSYGLATIRAALPESEAEERRKPAQPVVGDIRDGARNQTLTSMAGTMRRRGFTETAILAALHVENKTRCVPPLDDSEVAQIAGSIGRYEPGDVPKQPATIAMPETYNASALMLRTFAEPRWAVPGFVPEGLSALAGKPKMGKSWMALDIALGVALGRPVLGGIEVEQGDVLALFLEDGPRRLQERICQLLAPRAKPVVSAPTRAEGNLIRLAYSLDLPDPDRLIIAHRWPKLDKERKGLELIEQWVEEHPQARLIVIDTFGKVKPLPGRGSAYDADTEALGPLQQMALRRGIAVLMLTHLRKEKLDDPLEMINASMGFAGALDGALILNRVRGNADATLYVTGRDVKEDKDHALSWNAETARWSLSGGAAEARLTGERNEVLQAIKRASGWISARVIAQTLGKEEKAVRYLAGKLVAEGFVESSPKGYRVSPTTTGGGVWGAPSSPGIPGTPGTPSSPSNSEAHGASGSGW